MLIQVPRNVFGKTRYNHNGMAVTIKRFPIVDQAVAACVIRTWVASIIRGRFSVQSARVARWPEHQIIAIVHKHRSIHHGKNPAVVFASLSSPQSFQPPKQVLNLGDCNSHLFPCLFRLLALQGLFRFSQALTLRKDFLLPLGRFLACVMIDRFFGSPLYVTLRLEKITLLYRPGCDSSPTMSLRQSWRIREGDRFEEHAARTTYHVDVDPAGHYEFRMRSGSSEVTPPASTPTSRRAFLRIYGFRDGNRSGSTTRETSCSAMSATDSPRCCGAGDLGKVKTGR
jgi:hypothetical protein